MANFKFVTDLILTSAGTLKQCYVTNVLSATINPSNPTTSFYLIQDFGYFDGAFNCDEIFYGVPTGGSVTYNFPQNGCKLVFTNELPYPGATYTNAVCSFRDSNDNSIASLRTQRTDSSNKTFNVHFGFITDFDTGNIYLGYFARRIAGSDGYYDVVIATYPDWQITPYWNGVPAPPDPYGTMPSNSNPGTGYGPYDYTSETDLPPSLPSASAAQCGFVSLWNPTITELQGLASYLWTSGLFDPNTWRHLFSNPMDCILSVGIIPFVPDREENKEEIIFCGTSHSAISSYRVPTQMYIIPMGTMHITGMSQGYTDYEPYAKASLFLPYCGTYALSCDEIVDADLSLEYHVDIYTGACVAYLTITRTNSNGEQVNAVMYQFTGNMLSTIPVTGADHSNFIQSLLFMGAAIGATVASSGAAAPEIGGAMAAGDAVAGSTALTAATAGSAINTVMSMKPNVMRSGNLSSNAGLLGKQAPTITMTWSNICRPEDEYKLAGMPLHKSGTLSDFSGFTVVSAVHMDNILCTEEEKTMIEELLYKGVII